MSAPAQNVNDAKEILRWAVMCDEAGRVFEAQNVYKDGIVALVQTVDVDKLSKHNAMVFYHRVGKYVSRAEQLKQRGQEQCLKANIVENKVIEEDSCGNSYHSQFGKYVNSKVEEILIEEPDLRNFDEIRNLVVFLELAVRKCRKLKYVRIVTKKNSSAPAQQQNAIDQIRSDFEERNITLDIEFQDALNQHKILLSNGFIIKMEHGLDIYKPLNAFEMGSTGYDFRQCLATEVKILCAQELSR